MTRFGVMKHLGILERAGLVIARRQGRLRFNHLNAAPLHALQARWLSPRAAALAGAVADFSDTLGDGQMAQSNPEAGVVDVALEWPVAASVQKVWDALFQRPEHWWPAGHRAVRPRIRRCRWHRRSAPSCARRQGGQGIVWYRVIAIDPLRSVDLIGHLAARYGGPATSMLHIELVPGAADGHQPAQADRLGVRPDRPRSARVAERGLAGDHRRRTGRASGRRGGMIALLLAASLAAASDDRDDGGGGAPSRRAGRLVESRRSGGRAADLLPGRRRQLGQPWRPQPRL